MEYICLQFSSSVQDASILAHKQSKIEGNKPAYI